MSPSVDFSYFVEQSLMLACSFTLLVLQVLQVMSEYKIPEDSRPHVVGRLKYIFHRTVIICAALLVVRGIDPWGVYGIFSYGVVELLADNTSGLIMGIIYVAAFFTIRSGYRIIKRESPQVLRRVTLGIFILIMVVANVVGIVTLFSLSDNTLVKVCAVWLVFLAVVEIVIMFVFNWAVIVLRASVFRFHDELIQNRGGPDNDTSSTSDRVVVAMSSLLILQICGSVTMTIAAGTQTYVAVTMFISTQQAVLIPPASSYQFHANSLFIWLQMVALLIMTWHAWIPIRLSTSSLDEQLLAVPYDKDSAQFAPVPVASRSRFSSSDDRQPSDHNPL